METFSHSSYPESSDSSPHSREIDETRTPDDLLSTYKVKLMCSFGGKIQPRLHDNQLAYIGGDTKILSVDRGIKFSGMMLKIASLCGGATDICVKYLLPGEDLDALISVTNDEDLEHMLIEYDRLHRASGKPARLRLFLFSLKSFVSSEVKSERQWFVDALNSVNVQGLESSSPPARAAVSAENPDFLFGLDNNPVVPVTKFVDSPPSVPEIVVKDVSADLQCGSEDRNLTGDVSAAVNQQTADLQRLQIAGNNEQRKFDEANSRGFLGKYHAQQLAEKMTPVSTPAVGMVIPAAHLHQGHVSSTGYPMLNVGTEQPVYLIQAPALIPLTGQAGQGFYGMQRVVQEVYRDQPFYSTVHQPAAGLIQQQQTMKAVQPNVGVAEQGYVQVGYDSAGRQVYYTTSNQAVPVVNVGAVDGRQGGDVVNLDGKVARGNVVKNPQNSSG